MTISFASPRYGPNDEEFLGSLRDELAICTRYTTGSSEDALRLSACPDSSCRDVAPPASSRSSSPGSARILAVKNNQCATALAPDLVLAESVEQAPRVGLPSLFRSDELFLGRVRNESELAQDARHRGAPQHQKARLADAPVLHLRVADELLLHHVGQQAALGLVCVLHQREHDQRLVDPGL